MKRMISALMLVGFVGWAGISHGQSTDTKTSNTALPELSQSAAPTTLARGNCKKEYCD